MQRWAPPFRPPMFVPPLPPPRGAFRPPGFSLQPPRAYSINFLPRPPRPDVVDSERIWLDTFKRTHCQSCDSIPSILKECPLRVLRRRVVQAQKVVEKLKKAVKELVTIEKKLHEASSDDETLQLRAHHERLVGVCETFKKQLEDMNATSGLFPEQQRKQIEEFTRRVNKKKAYRKRAKSQRRLNASIHRTLHTKKNDRDNVMDSKREEGNQPLVEKSFKSSDEENQPMEKQTSAPALLTTMHPSPEQSLDPATLTIDGLIAVRRAWDAYIVYPRTPGASTIPPVHHVYLIEIPTLSCVL
ncbi:hypothetical protein PsorP6_016966 [Peronosclerospora sorghi]|uniref:Uncharacterized protein n=1 Tax=Peronosclerospora sorghi TaxID=230839 RepID=A0ACC0WD22_9STRA|nr:hypothetical protein PsorP6_016966 [Peronosclerospora sorghi]